MGKIVIGVSSWSDRSLVESDFYPPEVKTAAERLQYYSRNFAEAGFIPIWEILLSLILSHRLLGGVFERGERLVGHFHPPWCPFHKVINWMIIQASTCGCHDFKRDALLIVSDN